MRRSSCRRCRPSAGAPPAADTLARALGLAAEDVGFDGFAPSCWSAGIGFTFTPLKSIDAVRRAKPDLAQFASALTGAAHRAVFVFCRETAESGHDFHARMFAPSYGIVEDPATGSAAAAFAGVLSPFRRPSRWQPRGDDRAGLRDGPAEPHSPDADLGGRGAHRRLDRRQRGDGDRRHDRGLTAAPRSRRLPPMSEVTIFPVDRLDACFRAQVLGLCRRKAWRDR